MTREEALVQIFSKDAQLRLNAARELVFLAKEIDASVIRAALSAEAVPWVRSALTRARVRLERSSQDAQRRIQDPQNDFQISGGASEEAIKRDTIGQVLHELTPAVGRLKMAVMTDYSAYSNSRIAKEFDKLGELLDLFGRWRRVNSELRFSRVDLRELLQEIVVDEVNVGIVVTIQSDPKVSSVLTDREYLRAAIANGLRNSVQAIEAKKEARNGTEGITISYGITDRDFWVAINDEGVGLTESIEHVFQATMTTKPGHSGLGLPIALEAVTKLGGRLSLTSSSPGGAKFLIEVPLTTVES